MASQVQGTGNRQASRRSTITTTTATAVGWLILLLVIVAFVSSMVDVPAPALLVAAQGATGPLAAVPTALAVLAAYRRRPHLCRAAAAVAACILADVAAMSLAALPYRASAGDGVVRVVSANLLWENSDITEAASTLAALEPDVLVTIETLASFEPAITEAFAGEMVPLVRQPETETPVVVWVRPELAAAPGRFHTDAKLPSVQLAGLADEVVTVVGVHVESPERTDDVARWRTQIRDLKNLAATGGSVVFAGDFNASLAHPPMRSLLDHAGDAARASGRPWSPTWPAAPSRSVGHVPPVRVLDIDHIIVTPRLAVAGYEQVPLPGSDHDALAADLAISDTRRSLAP